MKDKNILICVGIIIYIAMSGIDRFVYHIPNIIYIPVAILGIALILIGFFKDKFKQENFDLYVHIISCEIAFTTYLFLFCHPAPRNNPQYSGYYKTYKHYQISLHF